MVRSLNNYDYRHHAAETELRKTQDMWEGLEFVKKREMTEIGNRSIFYQLVVGANQRFGYRSRQLCCDGNTVFCCQQSVYFVTGK
ncbi:unnamed protein product [Toxocara canis]|uniref:SCP domain-containing protein n=1 Tax=Toxocara canis TaxID=6265 RepID=A0A183V3U0_TOXCA|nr:unnamed protein product [Toxocara canis]